MQIRFHSDITVSRLCPPICEWKTAARISSPPLTHDDIVAQHFFPHFIHSLWRCFYEPASSTDKDTDDMHTTMLPNADDSDIATKSSLMMMLPLTAATAAAAAYER